MDDQASSPGRLPPVAVIGAGFSGTMAAIQLAGALPPERPVLLCERAEAFGAGLAYGTSNPEHLLNVRAANMSAYPDRPDHFGAWLDAAGEPDGLRATPVGLFAPRGLYGAYLAEQLRDAIMADRGPPRLGILPDEVVDVERDGAGFRLLTACGRSHRASGIVLALGNLRPARGAGSVRFSDPWRPGALEDIDPALPVVIVGTGLTMVDAVLSLRRSGFRAKVIAVSRRGLLPRAHAASAPWTTPDFRPEERASPARLLHRVRGEVARAAAAGVDWRGVIDALRPVTRDLWQGLGTAAKRSALRHLRAYWDVHRHRMAPPAADAVRAMLEEGSLVVTRGRILSLEDGPAHATVTLRLPGGGTATLNAGRVIDATGVESVARVEDALATRLLERGLVRLDDLGIGLSVAPDLTALDAGGAPVPGLKALGPIVRGVFWECTAVPDIRAQAADLAAHMAAHLAARPAALTGRP
jgi:uncharacterized NAD(P)/FAD-binding protein YdhS